MSGEKKFSPTICSNVLFKNMVNFELSYFGSYIIGQSDLLVHRLQRIDFRTREWFSHYLCLEW